MLPARAWSPHNPDRVHSNLPGKPLHIAVLAENIGAVALFAKYAADVNALTHDGKTALWYAQSRGSNEIAQVLIAYGAVADESVVRSKVLSDELIKNVMHQIMG